MMRRLPRRLTRLLAWSAGLIVVAAVAIGVALVVTPMQTVTVAGQVIKVGTTSPRLSLSGPGEVDLFGQSLPTVVRFTGPVRPKLALTQITIDSELANFAQGSSPRSATHLLGSRLDDGWTRYFSWEAGIAGLAALILTGAIAGWRRLPAGPTARLLVVSLVITQLINLGSIVLAARGAQQALGQARSLNALVGSDPPPPALNAAGPLLPGVQAVVIGDSTAAGAGLALVADASRIDRACGRSSDSYAEDLARANNWRVMNLACNSATISHGLLGPESKDGLSVPGSAGYHPAGAGRIGGHRERRRRRPELVSHCRVLRGRAALQRPRLNGVLSAEARGLQQGLFSAADGAGQLARPPARDHQPLLRPVRQ